MHLTWLIYSTPSLLIDLLANSWKTWCNWTLFAAALVNMWSILCPGVSVTTPHRDCLAQKSTGLTLLAVPQWDVTIGRSGDVQESNLRNYDPQIVSLFPKNEMKTTQGRKGAPSSETVIQKNHLDDTLEEASMFPKEGWVTLLTANLRHRTDLWCLPKWSGPFTWAFAFAWFLKIR